MQDSSTDAGTVRGFRQDIQRRVRDRIREAIEATLEEELTEALGSARHERTGSRAGYRHGAVTRTITTGEGVRTLTVPRGRLSTGEQTEEFQSTVLPRYARRTREVDDALLGCYLGGTNTRRMRTALTPLLGDRHLSKSAVSRVVAKLKTLWTTWDTRDLSADRFVVLFLDGFHLRVRLARRVVVVPVLAALGITETGQKQLVALRLVTTEATVSWRGLVTDLQARGLPVSTPKAFVRRSPI